jgi:hypothetical protein
MQVDKLSYVLSEMDRRLLIDLSCGIEDLIYGVAQADLGISPDDRTQLVDILTDAVLAGQQLRADLENLAATKDNDRHNS